MTGAGPVLIQKCAPSIAVLLQIVRVQTVRAAPEIRCRPRHSLQKQVSSRYITSFLLALTMVLQSLRSLSDMGISPLSVR